MASTQTAVTPEERDSIKARWDRRHENPTSVRELATIFNRHRTTIEAAIGWRRARSRRESGLPPIDPAVYGATCDTNRAIARIMESLR